MKFVSKIALSLVVASSFMFVGCMGELNTNNKEVAKPIIDDKSIGFRKVDLMTENEVTPDKTQYSESQAGSGKTIARAFQDAPPMIPHDTTGMLPITINNNQCMGCHAPGVAESMGALPFPKSHLTDFRPKHTFDGKKFEKVVNEDNNEISIKEMTELSGTRFNCSGCHAPQSDGQWIENNFIADFTSKDGQEKSSWSGTKLTEGLDTLKD
ncbi:MAG: nitrate reductase cytochrome c-type subunit [Arcobacteraceae bacterium]